MLCGELELPFALSASSPTTPTRSSQASRRRSRRCSSWWAAVVAVFADVLREALPRIAAGNRRRRPGPCFASGRDGRCGAHRALGDDAADGPAVLIMARAPRRGEVRHALEPLIGLDGCVALQSALLGDALRWARDVEPRAIYVAHDPPDAGPRAAAAARRRTRSFPQNGDGHRRPARRRRGTRVRPLPRPAADRLARPSTLRPDPRAAALRDLAAGADLVLGPVFDGGFYLIAMARPMPSLFALPEQAVARSRRLHDQVLRRRPSRL